MTRFLFAFTLMLFSITAFAVTFKAPSVTKTRGVETIESLVKCVKSGKPETEVKTCSAKLFAKSLNDKSKVALLAWLELPLNLAYPEACKSDDVELLPDDQLKKASLFLCSKYQLQGLDKQAIFMMTEEDGQLKLVNIKK